MGFQPPIDIVTALENIKRGDYVMPAIQRDYVWSQNQITWLFDSIMRGYPISSFLFWSVRGENVKGYKFYSFLRDYRETFRIRGEERQVDSSDRFLAILDGQQRLTSLFIGFLGSYAWRIYRGRWEDNTETSRPTRRLYLNISKNLDPSDEEDGRIYQFEFLKDADTQRQDVYVQNDGIMWFRVGKVLDLKGYADCNALFSKYNLSQFAIENIDLLSRMTREKIINFYLEEENDLHKALNIFIRINTGATQLTFSDIMMSIAISYWKSKDPKASFDQLTSDVRQIGYGINNDFILKTFLYLYSKDIRYKATNFKKDTALTFEDKWDDMSECIKEAFRLLNTFGYSGQSLPSTRAIIPIIYYLYHRRIWNNYSTSIGYKDDRNIIKTWLHQANLHRIFGGSSDNTLVKIRRAFTNDISVPMQTPITSFPAEVIKQSLGTDMAVSDELIHDCLHTEKDSPYAFPILSLLFPYLDYKNNNFHKDHLHAANLVLNFDVNSVQEEDRQYYQNSSWWNSILNLQLLDANENESKSNKSLKDWIDYEVNINKKDRDTLLQRCYIPNQASLDIKDFKEFLLAREKLLAAKLRSLLG